MKKIIIIFISLIPFLFIIFFLMSKKKEYLGDKHLPKFHEGYNYVQIDSVTFKSYYVTKEKLVRDLDAYYKKKIHGGSNEVIYISQFKQLPIETKVTIRKYLCDSTICLVSFDWKNENRGFTIEKQGYIPAYAFHEKLPSQRFTEPLQGNKN